MEIEQQNVFGLIIRRAVGLLLSCGIDAEARLGTRSFCTQGAELNAGYQPWMSSLTTLPTWVSFVVEAEG